MKIAVLGATGPSGLQVVAEALNRGHLVTALVRSPDKLKAKDDKLTVIKTDIFNPEELSAHLADVDAVLSCLGPPANWFNRKSVTFYSDSARSVTAAMTRASRTRLICMSSWYTVYNRSDPFLINWIFKPLVLRNMLHNMGDMEAFLATECPDVNFTSVRCPQLSNGASSGKPVRTAEGQEVKNGPFLLPRADVAKFMLDCAETGDWGRKCVAIATG